MFPTNEFVSHGVLSLKNVLIEHWTTHIPYTNTYIYYTYYILYT